MLINRLLLQNFRSYETADFKFKPDLTFIVGQNTAGKSNIIEAIHLLAYGKSFRAEKDDQLVRFNFDISRVKAEIFTQREEAKILEVVLAEPEATGKSFAKRYFLNDLPKRRVDFTDAFHVLLFEPTDLDLISGSPSLRRSFFDEVLEQTDKEYRHANLTYTRAIRQRNALLQRTRETGIRQEKQFSYWNEVVIESGSKITAARASFIGYLNEQTKNLFNFKAIYDQSVISEERLMQYKEAETASGVTLVGPHRDDLDFLMMGEENKELQIKSYGSRGQQRLAVVQLKLLQLQYLKEKIEDTPVLLLDDIFSELDENHIKHILAVVGRQQTIITTTHREFLTEAGVKDPYVIDLKSHSNS